MKIEQNIDLQGELKITAKYKDGSEEVKYKKTKNLIVDSAKLAILRSLVGISSSARGIDTLRVGTGGTVDPDGLYIKPVTGSQSSLFSQVEVSAGVPFELALTAALDTTQFTVTFLGDLGFGDLNGMLLTEAALYQGNVASGTTPTMFSIKVHPGIRKNSNFSLHYEWVIRV